jgi:hypothetical protein
MATKTYQDITQTTVIGNGKLCGKFMNIKLLFSLLLGLIVLTDILKNIVYIITCRVVLFICMSIFVVVVRIYFCGGPP